MTDKKEPRTDLASRRSFLKLSAAAAGVPLLAATSVATPQSAAAAGSQSAPSGAKSTPGFEHLVVLMFANRSFDNLLGFLYPPGSVPAGQSFDGAANGDHSNASPGGPVPAHLYEGSTDFIMRSPTPDPARNIRTSTRNCSGPWIHRPTRI